MVGKNLLKADIKDVLFRRLFRLTDIEENNPIN